MKTFRFILITEEISDFFNFTNIQQINSMTISKNKAVVIRFNKEFLAQGNFDVLKEIDDE